MATMYSLFFGILLIAVCSTVGIGDGAVGAKNLSPLRNRRINAGAGLPTRARIIHIATQEIGVREATGRNDGRRVEEYLRYTHLGKGYEWCAAFVCWCYGQAGLPEPRNPWSPALFPKARKYSVFLSRHAEFISASQSITRQGNVLSLPAMESSYRKEVSAGKQQMLSRAQHDVPIEPRPADLFALYSTTARRIHHVGLVKDLQGKYLITIEGNSHDRVESRRRHLSTIYALSDWVTR